MKTIEEKAKAYDNIVFTAKGILDNPHADEEKKKFLKGLIPELRESEDERIRKELIDIIKRSYEIGGFTLNNKELRDKYIAYLERQKEQKPTSFNDPYNPDEYEVVMEGNATSLKRKEQKPAWSEEEKDNISILLCMIDSMDSISLPSGTLRISGEKRRELKEFIKRPSWKPTQEQMEALLVAIHCTPSDENMLISLYNDLKKL